MTHRIAVLVLSLACQLAITGCSEADGQAPPTQAPPPRAARPAPGPGILTGVSSTMVVTGAYTPVALDRVVRVSMEQERLVIHGSSSNVTVDLPAAANPAETRRAWALVTESNPEGRRVVTFTHSDSLDDFTIDLPESPGSIRYGTLAGRERGEVLILAWGEDSASYWGYVTIEPRPAP